MTQIDSLTRTVNTLVETNSENINKLVNLDVVTSYMLVIFLGILMTIILGFILYVVYTSVSDKLYSLRYELKMRKSEKFFEEIIKNTSFTDWLFEKTHRKYEILSEVSKYVDDKYVKYVTDFVWNYYKVK